ncbi:radical SAM family heme chaperone HemW [Alicyclobacillus mengziensis]|uniref:Heme chaperone HemW n=1 Tax=Alicyclobacillus mengziensis TaxID=2931921 RepID=A0A9X7VW25_9BACL|nr:radical SAM family heme chaperone HemW [Alicyclobacillus mengziensis]QSO46119.1 oxygen-independent coproporphyrinogen III oxidase [Alicyclobacillus mengziensis]
MTSQLFDSTHQQDPASLYVHIPFCKSRCFYCDFTTYVAPRSLVTAYVSYLKQEFELLARDTNKPLQTVFFGGGTPTYLSANELGQVFASLHQHFNLASDAEITVEANPGTVDAEKLVVLREYGVNRISFGAQTFDENLLMAIGRTHDKAAILSSVELALRHGFSRINLDLMFGLPEQTLDSVRQAVKQVVEMGVRHVSAYWLKVEPGTPFHKWQEQGLLPLPGEDSEADMYELVREMLSENGFVHYEVSNFATPGEEALHNLVYWHNEPYLAAGVGGHGYVRGRRYENVTALTDYARLLSAGMRPIADTHQVSAEESAEDTMMLGLRLREGVSAERFRQRHGASIQDVFFEQIQRLTGQGLIQEHSGTYRLTDRAWPIANVVFEEFVGALTVGAPTID